MTPAEAHVWIAVFAAMVTQPSSIIPDMSFAKAIAAANRAVERLNEEAPSALSELDSALRQGSDIP